MMPAGLYGVEGESVSGDRFFGRIYPLLAGANENVLMRRAGGSGAAGVLRLARHRSNPGSNE
jgi:hypothetical protein